MYNNKKWLIGGAAVALFVCLGLGAACLLGGLTTFGIARQVSPVVFTHIATVEVLSNVATETLEPQATQTAAATATSTAIATATSTATATAAAASASDSATATAPTAEETSTAAATPLPAGPQALAGQEASETLNTLEKSVVPINDPRDLARRLEGEQNIPATMEPPKTPLQIGDRHTFWASNVDTNKNFQVDATLRYITDHLYFWVGNGVSYDQSALKRLADTFESKIYPTDRAFFGSEWSPGIDGDVHLYVLYTYGLGGSVAGYFSSADELPPQAHPYSNAHEMFMLNADTVRLSTPFIYGTMAHEFQHMIHWYRDRNEEAWMNEGFSVLAQFLTGYSVGGFDSLYVTNPDMQLTIWPSSPDDIPHYGSSFLFLDYFLNRFGDKATQAVVANTDNGMDSIDEVLASLHETDPQTGKTITADDVFADWVVATYLDNPQVGDGRFTYKNYPNAPKTKATEEISTCSPDWQNRSVHQYGVDYIKIDCPGNYTLQFKGAAEVGVLPVNAHSGSYAFWSNKGDESDMTLTRAFDFTQASGSLTLQYAAWYDLEKDYDYAYLEVSTDDGSTWQILKTPSGRDKALDPSGNAYGWGYNGQSQGWVEEKVDLSSFAGKKVQLRFEYITDEEVNGEGFLLDDVRIPEINYSTDFEKDDGGWQGAGFVRIQNHLPQLYRVSLIQQGKTVSVKYIPLDRNQLADIPLQIGGDVQDVVLVVSGVTRFTTQEAAYQFRFEN